MKRYILTIILFLPLIIIAQNTKSKEGNIITWTKDSPLTWADFKGGAENADKQEAAAVYTQLTMTPDAKNKDTVKYFIYAQAVKNKSWRLKTANTDYLLKHEQTHFDISELFAREFRKELSETAFTTKTLNNQIEKLFKKYYKLLGEEQTKYDKETVHSINKDKQEEWNNKIKEELSLYKLYSDPVVILNVN